MNKCLELTLYSCSFQVSVHLPFTVSATWPLGVVLSITFSNSHLVVLSTAFHLVVLSKDDCYPNQLFHLQVENWYFSSSTLWFLTDFLKYSNMWGADLFQNQQLDKENISSLASWWTSLLSWNVCTCLVAQSHGHVWLFSWLHVP